MEEYVWRVAKDICLRALLPAIGLASILQQFAKVAQASKIQESSQSVRCYFGSTKQCSCKQDLDSQCAEAAVMEFAQQQSAELSSTPDLPAVDATANACNVQSKYVELMAAAWSSG